MTATATATAAATTTTTRGSVVDNPSSARQNIHTNQSVKNVANSEKKISFFNTLTVFKQSLSYLSY